jgi:flagellar basal body-associated protein FliL
MSAITWIVIILILVSILVTVTEVGLRFAMLERSKKSGDNAAHQISWQHSSALGPPPSPPQLLLHSHPHEAQAQTQNTQAEMLPSALEELAVTLGLQGNATLEAVKEGIRGLQLHADCEAPVVEAAELK